MQQPFEITSNLHNGMTNIDKVWYTGYNHVSSMTLTMAKEKIE